MYVLDSESRICKNDCVSGNFKPVKAISDTRFKTLCSGTDSYIALDLNGNAWVHGSNSYGKLGLGRIKKTTAWVQVLGLPTFTQVKCRKTFTLLLDTQGNIWASGVNDCGNLGLGDRENRSFFEKVRLPISVKDVAMGSSYSVALDCNGNLWGAGSNMFGQLGNSDDNLSFQRINHPSTSKITAVECGDSHTVTLDENGKMWVTGYNSSGQLGLCHRDAQRGFVVGLTTRFSKIFAGRKTTVALDLNGNVFSCGNAKSHEKRKTLLWKIDKVNKVVEISEKVDRSIFLLDASNTLWCLCIDRMSLIEYEKEAFDRLKITMNKVL